MSEKRIAFVFPAFVSEYPDDPIHHLPGLSNLFTTFLKEASDHLCTDLSKFDLSSLNFLEDEQKTQYITYIFSAALSTYLKDTGIKAAFCAGYSMGVYASLFYADVISFKEGLVLVHRAFESARSGSVGKEYSMGTVIGLSLEDILGIINNKEFQVRITNQNSRFSFVLAGLRKDIIQFLDFAKQEGALNTRMIMASAPYHTEYIHNNGVDHRTILSGISFSTPSVPMVSLIDQKILSSENDIIEEIVRNLYSPMNWYRTQLFLQKSDVDLFLEVGFGNTLTKNAKFIEGDFKFLSATSPHFMTDVPRSI